AARRRAYGSSVRGQRPLYGCRYLGAGVARLRDGRQGEDARRACPRAALVRAGDGAAERERLTMRLTVLGCGDAFGSGGRFNTCFMVETADRTVLLDCGATSLVALRARNLDPNVLDGVILTHLHGDHFGGLPFFLLDAHVV